MAMSSEQVLSENRVKSSFFAFNKTAASCEKEYANWSVHAFISCD